MQFLARFVNELFDRLAERHVMMLAALCLFSCSSNSSIETETRGEQQSALTTVVQINSGGAAVGSFVADRFATGGGTYAVPGVVSTSGVVNAAPAAVYQSERYGNFLYTFAGLSAGASYTVRLHFAEVFFTSAGSRLFNVVINGSQVVTSLDIYATAGSYKALVRDFTVPASTAGQIVIQYVNVVDNAKSSGVEIYATGSGNAAPTIATPATANPNPTSGGTVTLSVLGADDGGESNLTYTWSTVGASPAAVSFSTNGSNAAKNVSATFSASGTYTLSATVRDAMGAVVSSNIDVMVNLSAPTTSYRINCGGGAVSPFSADQFATGGNVYSSSTVIPTSGVQNAAPATVYESERYGNFSYTLGMLTPGASYGVRLHFAELYYSSAGARSFNVKINGTQVLTNLDIVATVGAKVPLVRDFTTTATSGGQVVISYVNVIDNAKCSGIELYPATGAANAAPTVATAPTATPKTSGTASTLSVRGADDGGEANLTYSWATTGAPPAAVSFAPNGTNAAKDTVATFTKVGSYAFSVSIRDSGGASVTSNLNVVVSQQASSITVTPGTAQAQVGTTQQFAAVATDQFGAALSSQPPTNWSVSGGGVIDTSGGFTAGSAVGGPFSVVATSGSTSGNASVMVTGASSSVAYTTSFGVNESPLSEGGKWKHNNPWFTKVVANGGNVYGTSPNPANAGKYEDSYAFLGGMGFPPDQYASAHIYKNGTTGGYLEVELQLRVSDTANSTRGYECFLHQSGLYLAVARWSGAPMSGPASISYFDVLGTVNNVTAPKDGDLFEAQIVGNIITVKLAGATLYTLDVSKFDGVVIASGDPGIGFDAGGSGAETADSSYGFKDFSAKGL